MKCTILSPWNQIDNCTLKGSLNHFKISSMNGLIRDLSSNRKPAFSSSSQLASWNDRPKNDLKKWRFPTTLDTKKYDFKKWWREKKTFCQKKGEKKKNSQFLCPVIKHPRPSPSLLSPSSVVYFWLPLCRFQSYFRSKMVALWETSASTYTPILPTYEVLFWFALSRLVAGLFRFIFFVFS